MSKVPNPTLRSGSFGVLTVSFFAPAIAVKEVDSFALGLWTVTQWNWRLEVGFPARREDDERNGGEDG